MTKKKLLIVSVVLIAVIACCVFAACKPPKTNLEQVADLISAKQDGLWTGSCESFRITLTKTTEEETFLADGVVGVQKERVVLSLRPATTDFLEKEYTYVLKGETGELKGSLQKDRIGIAFTAQINDFAAIGKVNGLVIGYDDVETEIALTDRLENMIAYDKALEIAYNAYHEQIDEALADGGFKREVYLRLVNDRRDPDSDYLWYVSFIAGRDDYWSVMIRPDDGTVVSKREHVLGQNM